MHHVGIVVEDLAAATDFFLALGLERGGESYRLCYLRGPDGVIVELAERLGAATTATDA